MPTFEDFQLSTDIAAAGIGAVSGGPSFRTAVTTTGNGSEQRNGEAGVHARRIFRLNTDAMETTTRDTCLDFFTARRGSTDSFRFRDPFDYTATAQPLISVTGGRQLVKEYTLGAYTYYRPIQKPVSGTVTLTGGGSVDYSTGIVTGGSGGTWSGDFDIQARFVDDRIMRRSITYAHDALTLGVMEVFDIDLPALSNTEPDATLSYELTLKLQVGRAASPIWNTRLYTTGVMEERTQYFSADRILYDPIAVLLKDATDMHTLISLFLIARGRRSAFTYAGATCRFASDYLNISRTGTNTHAATIPIIEL